MIKLSIIIPVYNTEKYLHRCIESVLRPKKEWLELIIVDDGSNDVCADMCDEYGIEDDNIKVIHKTNGGLSSARNTGLEVASGEFIAFLDSDDLFDTCFIDDMEKYFNEVWDILDFKYCYEKKPGKYSPKGTKAVKFYTNSQYIDLYNRNKFGDQICFRVYNKKMFEHIKFPIGRYYEDIATFYKIMLKARNIMMVDYEYYIYNISNEASITKRVKRKYMEDMIKSVDEMYYGLSNCGKINIKFLEYKKINQYIYIWFKLIKCEENVNDLKKYILSYLKNKKIQLKYLSQYNVKKYIAFKLLNAIGVFT